MIVVDTNVVSELMRPSPDQTVLEWVASAGPELRTTAITVAEIRYGLERLAGGRRRDRLRAAADEVFTVFSDYVLPFDAEAAVHYALIVSHCDGIGRPIDGFDAQIAAICRTRGATLATRNLKDFRETGVDLIDPWLPRTMRG
jgi:toxin FitB